MELLGVLVLVRPFQVEDRGALRAVLGGWRVEFVARVAHDWFEVVMVFAGWFEVVLAQDRVVRVLVDEVAVRAEHARVWCPAEVAFCHAFVHQPLGKEVCRS